MANQAEHQQPAPKKPRLVFTDLQRRTLQAIFKVSTTRACTHNACTYTYTCIRTYTYTQHVTSYPLWSIVIALFSAPSAICRGNWILRERYHRLIRRLLAATNFRGRNRIYMRVRTCTHRTREDTCVLLSPIDRRFLKYGRRTKLPLHPK